MIMEKVAHPNQLGLFSELQEWAAYNLAIGESKLDVARRLLSCGLSQSAAEAIIGDIGRNPIFHAASRIAKEKKKLSDLNDLILDLDNRSESRSQVPVETNIEATSFFENYYTANRPVILKGIVNKWPAVDKWSLDFFRHEFGSTVIQYQCRDLSDDHVQAFFENSRLGTLASYIDLIESDGPDVRQYYLMSQDQLLRRIAFRRLLEDVDCSHGGIFDEGAKARSTHFWLGPKGVVTPMHRDQNNIYLAQIIGRKKVMLVSPLSIDRIYNAEGHHSEINFDAIDFDRFKRARELRILEAIISPGDLLFIPVAWWHHVTSLDLTLSISGTNFKYDNEFPQLSDYFG